MQIGCRLEGSVALLTWDDGENRLNLDSLRWLNERLDELEETSGPLAIVLTGTGKFFSNGFDLDRFGSDPAEFQATIKEFCRSVGRLLVYPAYSVAAINGHCFAAGALLSCGFDYRVMRSDRGYWCMNEAEIGIALNEELWSILEHRLPRASAITAITTARRYGGPDALAAGIVEATASEDQVVAHAQEVASKVAALDRRTLEVHKRLAHQAAARRLGFDG